VAGGLVGRGERVRQDRQPLAQQPVDVLGPECVADLLEQLGVVDGGEGVVHRGETEAGLGGPALGPVVAVDA
jgi:hypothetical protein